MEKIITGCNDCPLLGVIANCSHPSIFRGPLEFTNDLTKHITIYKTPEWCPLKKESLTLKFKHK